MTATAAITAPWSGYCSMEEYLALPAVSRTELRVLGQGTPHDLKRMRARPQRVSDAMDFGSVGHLAVLEPDLIKERVIVTPPKEHFGVGPGGGPTKAGRAAKAQWLDAQRALGLYVLKDDEELQRIYALRDRIVSMRGIRKILEGGGECEKSYMAEDPATGELVKCRVDFLSPEGAEVDLKFTGQPMPRDVDRSIPKYGYDVQRAMTHEIINAVEPGRAVNHYLLIIETDDDGKVQLVNMSQWMQGGALRYHDWLRQYHECRKAKKWPGLPPTRQSNPPTWYLHESEELERKMRDEDPDTLDRINKSEEPF